MFGLIISLVVAGIAGWLKVRFQASEIVTTIRGFSVSELDVRRERRGPEPGGIDPQLGKRCLDFGLLQREGGLLVQGAHHRRGRSVRWLRCQTDQRGAAFTSASLALGERAYTSPVTGLIKSKNSVLLPAVCSPLMKCW